MHYNDRRQICLLILLIEFQGWNRGEVITVDEADFIFNEQMGKE